MNEFIKHSTYNISMIVSSSSQLPKIRIKLAYETSKTIKFNICYELGDRLRVLYVSPHYDARDSDSGHSCMISKNNVVIFLSDSDTTFIRLLEDIGHRVDACIREEGSYRLDIPALSEYNTKDGLKRSVWCDIIQKSDGKVVYTKCYDKVNNPVDITSLVAGSIIRPCLSFRVSYSKTTGKHRLRASLSELCVMEIAPANSHRMTPT